MAQNVTIAGASYSDVPSIVVPKTGGGIATFYDVSGNQAITVNGTYNIASKETVSVNIESDSFILEYTENNGVFTFDSTYAEIKAAVQAGKTFRYTSFGDDTIGAWYGSCYATNVTFQSITFTECVRFYLQSMSRGVCILYYGYSGGVLTQASIVEYLHPNGSQTITENGTYDISTKASVTVNVSGGGGGAYTIYTGTSAPSGASAGDIWVDYSNDIVVSNTKVYHGYQTVASSSQTNSGMSLQITDTGTYKISWTGCRNTTSGTSGSQLYINNTAYGSNNTTFVNSYFQSVELSNVSLTAGDTIAVYAQARSSSYKMMVGNLIAEKL